MASKEGRAVSAALLLTQGEFYDGDRFEAQPTVTVKFNRHFQFSQSVSSNWIELDNDRFALLLLRSHLNYALNTKLSAGALVQYDSDLRETAINVRLGYLFREGTELFVVYDHGEEKEFEKQTHGRLLVKLTYQFH